MWDSYAFTTQMWADPSYILVCILVTVFSPPPTKLMKASNLLLQIIRFLHTRFYSFCVCVLAEKNDISKWPKSDEFDSRGWGEGRCSA